MCFCGSDVNPLTERCIHSFIRAGKGAGDGVGEKAKQLLQIESASNKTRTNIEILYMIHLDLLSCDLKYSKKKAHFPKYRFSSPSKPLP